MEKTAVIVGGSIAGLMTGIMLRHHGYHVVILEKDPETLQRRSHAAGVAPGPDFKAFLEKYAPSSPIVATKGGAVICAKDGSTKRNLPMVIEYSSWGLINGILRANFDGQASSACKDPPDLSKVPGKAEYWAGKRVKAVEFVDEKVVVKYINLANKDDEEHSITADIAIAADGSLSTVRSLIFPKSQRQYVGYIAWRGTVPETNVSPETSKFFDSGMKFFQDMPQSYMNVYKIPSEEGEISPGKKMINWVWYQMLPAESQELRDTMTDVNGREHFNIVTRDLVHPNIWEAHKRPIVPMMAPPFADLIQNTKTPFITKVNDVISPQAVVKDKLFILGEALHTIRPHTGQATNQAAFQIRMLEKMIEGQMSPAEWGREVLRQGRITGQLSHAVGMFGLKRYSALVLVAAKYLMLVALQRLFVFSRRLMGKKDEPGFTPWVGERGETYTGKDLFSNRQ